MKQFTAAQKHEILLEYRSYSTTHSFSALASHHVVDGGKRTVQRWYQQWNGTISSLHRKKVSGRPRILTHAQVKRHIQPRIRAKNRSHTPIVYPDLLSPIVAATGKSMSLRTLERYGKNDLDGRPTHGTKRTREEGE